MKAATIILVLFLVDGVSLQAQQFPTNSIDTAEAIKIASCLRPGMPEQEVAKILDEQHGLRSGGDVGGSGGWTRFYLLTNKCFLDLQMEPKKIRLDGRWGGNGLLQSASILSNRVKIFAIALTNTPQLSGAANGSQPIRSETNSTSSEAGSRRGPLR